MSEDFKSSFRLCAVKERYIRVSSRWKERTAMLIFIGILLAVT